MKIVQKNEDIILNDLSLKNLVVECIDKISSNDYKPLTYNECLKLEDFVKKINDGFQSNKIRIIHGTHSFTVMRSGDVLSSYLLSYMHFHGLGIEKSFQKSYYWSELIIKNNPSFYLASEPIIYITMNRKIKSYNTLTTNLAWKQYVKHNNKIISIKDQAVDLLIKNKNLLPILKNITDPQKNFMGKYDEAKSGDQNAILHLSILYMKGIGVPKNISLGIKFIQKLDFSLDVDINHLLGVAYITGNGVDVDVNQAVKFLNQSSKLGNNDSSYLLMYVYWLGLTGEPDLVQAYKYLNLSKDVNAEYEIQKENLEKLMTKQQIQEALDLSNNL